MTGTKIDTIKIRQLNREQTFEYIKKNPMAARADVAKELNLSDQYRYRVGRSRTDPG